MEFIEFVKNTTRNKLKEEAQKRNWDHVFYIIMEDYQDKCGDDVIFSPKREDYIVSLCDDFYYDRCFIKVLGKFGVSFKANRMSNFITSSCGRFNAKGELHGYSLQTADLIKNLLITFDGSGYNIFMRRTEGVYKNGKELNTFVKLKFSHYVDLYYDLV